MILHDHHARMTHLHVHHLPMCQVLTVLPLLLLHNSQLQLPTLMQEHQVPSPILLQVVACPCLTNLTHPCLEVTTLMRMATPQHSLGTLASHLLILSRVTTNLPMGLLRRDTHKVLLLHKVIRKEGLLPLSKATLVH